jgi:NAD(P)-dependent dehydrogenase (short-subunit alcohol dehydrogenase family)
MDVRVDDKVLLVTGATQGVGRAVALEAARSGAAAIILTGRNRQRGTEAVSEILQLGAKAAFVGLISTSETRPKRLFWRQSISSAGWTHSSMPQRSVTVVLLLMLRLLCLTICSR